jgi:putative ABC transport system permease protein
MYVPSWGSNNVTIRISGPIENALNHINKVWKETYPDYQLEYSFYDEYFASMYKKEENLASLVNMFSILAIIISGLGIFGLSVYQSEQRIKEIGIRKVLGASSTEITFLLSKSFSKWVLFANIIAFPIAYYFVNKWLQDFAYRIDLSWWVFVLSGGIALVIALITVSVHAIKAAIANPIEALRYE